MYMKNGVTTMSPFLSPFAGYQKQNLCDVNWKLNFVFDTQRTAKGTGSSS